MMWGKEMLTLSSRASFVLPIWLIYAFLKPTDLILFKYGDKSWSVNFTQYDIMPHNMKIISRPYITVTSLYPMYVNVCRLRQTKK